jgi:hypothetical protein
MERVHKFVATQKVRTKMTDETKDGPDHLPKNQLESLRGIGKGLWDEWGGGEAWLRQERENFYGEKGEPQWSRIPSA